MTALFCFLIYAAPVFAQADAQVEKAARELSLKVTGKPEGLESLFDRSFFGNISIERFRGMLSGIYRDNGRVTEVRLESAGPGLTGHFIYCTDKGFEIPAALSLDPESGRIIGLFFKAARKKSAALAQAAAGLSALPGKTGLFVVRLGSEPVTLAALNEKEYFAVGPVANLYVLGGMLEKGMFWNKVLRIREEDRSLPPGRLRDWPAGSTVTVRELAAMMISESDNIAADTLISALGRRRLEAALPGLRYSSPALLRPFLKTSEMLRLRSDTGASLKYLNLPAEEKYIFLSGLGRAPLSPELLKRSPFGVDKADWVASPADICGLMGYFADSGSAEALKILALNPGISLPEGKITYAGYKGGSEPGVLSAAWLLKNGGGEWFCVAASWNSEKEDLEETKFSGLLRDAIKAVGVI